MVWFVTIDSEKCTGEGKCAEICPVEAFKVEGGKCILFQADLCEGCESCLAECPVGAITLKEI